MQFSTSLTVLGLVALGQSHMLMNTPVPYGKSSLNNSPLNGDGSDFPCKQRPGVYNAEGASNQMALGSTQPLSFTGSAVHGGGSCQISVTYDKQPNKNSVFKVIHSIEGGCPMAGITGNNGNDANQLSPTKYSFKIPSDLPTGDATLAWTWSNKVGNRELYMNCAPITITGGASKRDEDDALSAHNATQLLHARATAFNSLPDMFVANIDNTPGSCKTADNKNVRYPNPGASVDFMGVDGDLADPIGNCGSASGSPAPVVSGSPPAQTSSAAATKPTLPGGVFVPVPGTGGETRPTSTVAAPVKPTASAAPVAPVTPVTPPKPIAPAPPASSGPVGSGQALSGPCSTEGQWNCIGGSSFQQCGSGTWSAVQQLSAGTKCTAGQSAVINISAISKPKRAIRFSHEHFRRHLRSS